MATTLDVRDFLVRRLREDLVGPSNGRDEVISGRPSDLYLTGILFPRNAFLSAEEDEKLEADDEEEEVAAADQVALWRTRRPASAGVSFAVRPESDKAPVLQVEISCAIYKPAENPPDAEEKPADGKSRRRRTASWKRHPLECVLDLPVILGANDPTKPFEEFPELELHLRTARELDALTVTAVLVNQAEQDEALGRDAAEQATLFQVGMTVRAKSGCRLIPRPSRAGGVDDEDARITGLIYRNQKEWAAGHTCAAEWDSDGDLIQAIRTAWLPSQKVWSVSPEGAPEFEALRRNSALQPLSASWLAQASPADLAAGLSMLPAAYRAWIARQSGRISGMSLATDERSQALENLRECERAAGRMSEAITLLTGDSSQGRLLRRAYQLANQALVLQRQWQNALQGDPSRDLKWRPFQLGFQLMALPSLADGAHPDRQVMDLLWFPTGGGKTEAYLGLIASILFLRRLRSQSPMDGLGTAVIMRYTLRTLTAQQFERAAALICACEHLRREAEAELGAEPFSIGLWVGSDATPNRVANAFQRDPDDHSDHRQLVNCPACGKTLSWVFEPTGRPKTVKCWCRHAGCVLGSGARPLPVWTIDELIYEVRPSLLIGTVDKFAQVVRNPSTHRFFGGGRSCPPELVIQDELHLISGPLGTMTGLYETAIDFLCSNRSARPKVIGSTATIRRASHQVRALFDRSTFQFPPPGLDASDSGFAVRAPDSEVPGRLYLGITSAGRSMKFALQATAASLSQSVFAARGAIGASDAVLDPYYTLVCYFNTLAELGGAMIVIQDDVPASMREYSRRRQVGESKEPTRELAEPAEMTSRIGSAEIRDRLQDLRVRAGMDGCIDSLLATNMLSVGVDIPRLGVMLVNGQPKSMAEYIQATSRVGRREPGLVVALYNHNRARDRSHFETFATWHTALYREVEAASVTPFASRARDRALHAALVALVRHRCAGMLEDPRMNAERRRACNALAAEIVKRAKAVDSRESRAVEAELHRLLDEWEQRTGLSEYWPNRASESGLLMGAEEAAAQREAFGETVNAWATPNTMRTVEPGTCLRLREFLGADVNDAENVQE
ncbi:MAG: helicase-related protein [Phycisphaerales bacterium]